MNEYQNHYYQQDQALDTKVSQVMKKVYVKMFFGLLVTAFRFILLRRLAIGSRLFQSHSAIMWVILLVELGLVFAITGAINRMSSATATMLFYLFAVVNGLALFPIFLVYTGVSIGKTFFITAGTFGAMSVYGYLTSQDLTNGARCCSWHS